mmetsp:Transcript_143866/g.460549  ORF Transcript_143866/g.460549 Transcript_143866/m.460549 type:complete len:327 (-) Transcript_143866:439-1419(-)
MRPPPRFPWTRSRGRQAGAQIRHWWWPSDWRPAGGPATSPHRLSECSSLRHLCRCSFREHALLAQADFEAGQLCIVLGLCLSETIDLPQHRRSIAQSRHCGLTTRCVPRRAPGLRRRRCRRTESSAEWCHGFEVEVLEALRVALGLLTCGLQLVVRCSELCELVHALIPELELFRACGALDLKVLVQVRILKAAAVGQCDQAPVALVQLAQLVRRALLPGPSLAVRAALPLLEVLVRLLQQPQLPRLFGALPHLLGPPPRRRQPLGEQGLDLGLRLAATHAEVGSVLGEARELCLVALHRLLLHLGELRQLLVLQPEPDEGLLEVV